MTHILLNWLSSCDIYFRQYSIPLILGVATAMVHANVDPASYRYFFGSSTDIAHFAFFGDFKLFGIYSISLSFLINDCFMVYFFGFVLKHVIEALIPPSGSLFPFKRALTPIVSSLSAIFACILIYILFVSIFGAINAAQWDTAQLLRGCAVTISTDTVLSWMIANIMFSQHLDHAAVAAASNMSLHAAHPCIAFLLLLSMVDDVIGLIVIAIFYGDQSSAAATNPWCLLLVLVAVVAAFVCNRFVKLRKWWVYVFVIGGISWLGLALSALHPALALFPILPFMLVRNKPTVKISQRVQHDLIRHGDESEVSGDFDHLADARLLRDDAASSGDETETSASPNLDEQTAPYSLEMLDDFERKIDRVVEYGLFFTAYCNAGIEMKQFGGVTVIVFLTAIIGKVAGVSGGALLVHRVFGWPLPFSMELEQLPLVGFCASVTMSISLFIANVAFMEDVELKEEAKMGVLLVPVVALIGAIAYRYATRRRATITVKWDNAEPSPSKSAALNDL